jgi:hypothetical protein
VADQPHQSPYHRRPDGKIAATLDNNVWDFLFRERVDLALELAADAFLLFIPREIEIETLATPETAQKEGLKHFVDGTIRRCYIKTTYTFGFALPTALQRRGGFGVGTF